MPSLLQIALPALAAIGGVSAAACSMSGTTTLQNSGDATALASACSTFSGNIAIATGTSDDLSFDGLKQLSGNLVVKDVANVKRISASDLETITGEMNLDGVQRLAGTDFPKLKSVGSLKWQALPNLQETGLTAQIEKAKSIDIQNTALRSLKGFNIQQIDSIFIANNYYVSDISLQLSNVTKFLNLADNNKDVKVDLSNLIWAANLTFRSCASINLPSLSYVNGSIGLFKNTIDSFNAPNLTFIGQALAIENNEKLGNLSFPQLTKIQDNLDIRDNAGLSEVTGFPELTRIGGAFDVYGNMSKCETPKMNDVAGTFNLQSSENITSACAFYQTLKDKKNIRGGFFCKGKVVDPGTTGHKPNEKKGSGNSSGGSTLSATNGALALAAMAAIMLF